MRRLLKLILLFFILLILLLISFYEWICFLNFFPSIIDNWYLVFTLILLHNLWTGFFTAFAFYLAAIAVKEIDPKIIERDPVFRYPRISSFIISIFLILISALKAPQISLLQLDLRALLPLLIIATIEVYGAYCLIQMGLRMKAEVHMVMRAFLAFLLGALLEASFIVFMRG